MDRKSQMLGKARGEEVTEVAPRSIERRAPAAVDCQKESDPCRMRRDTRFFGAFWLFLDDKESLDGRNVLSVLVAPNFRLVSSATREVATFDHNSPYCRIIFERYKPAPIRPGCVNWRRPNLTTSVSPLTSNGYWQGSYKTTISPAYPDLYAGASRTNAVESIRSDLSLFIAALITPGALLLMALMGTATGFRYFRRISGSSEL